MGFTEIVAGCADLVAPQVCAGCGEPGGDLCEQCVAEFAGPTFRCELGAPRLVPADGGPGLAVWSRACYAGSVREAVASWKRRGRAGLTPVFAGTLAAIGQELAGVFSVAGLAGVAVVPIPSRALSALRRGSGPAYLLARGLAAGLRRGGLAAPVRRWLGRPAGSRDQVGLGVRARAANRHGATFVRRRAARHRDEVVLLVDDVVTTGASLLDAERALARAGVGVLGAAVLAAAPASGHLRLAR